MVASQAVEQMSEGPQYVRKAWYAELSKIATDFREKFGGMLALSVQFTSAVGTLTQNRAQAQIDALDKEYEYRREVIEKSTKSEEEKQKALEKLESEYEAKKKAMQRAAAKTQKQIATINAIMNTAEAITAALATKPFLPMGPIMAAMAAVMGGVQIAAIKAQPLPLITGAYTGAGEGLAYLHPREIVAPQPMMRETFREIIREERVNQPVFKIYLDGNEVKGMTVRIVEQAFRRRQLGRNIIQ